MQAMQAEELERATRCLVGQGVVKRVPKLVSESKTDLDWHVWRCHNCQLDCFAAESSTPTHVVLSDALKLVDDTFEEDEPPNFSKVFRVVVAAAPRDEHVDDSLFAESAELDTIAAAYLAAEHERMLNRIRQCTLRENQAYELLRHKVLRDAKLLAQRCAVAQTTTHKRHAHLPTSPSSRVSARHADDRDAEATSSANDDAVDEHLYDAHEGDEEIFLFEEDRAGKLNGQPKAPSQPDSPVESSSPVEAAAASAGFDPYEPPIFPSSRAADGRTITGRVRRSLHGLSPSHDPKQNVASSLPIDIGFHRSMAGRAGADAAAGADEDIDNGPMIPPHTFIEQSLADQGVFGKYKKWEVY